MSQLVLADLGTYVRAKIGQRKLKYWPRRSSVLQVRTSPPRRSPQIHDKPFPRKPIPLQRLRKTPAARWNPGEKPLKPAGAGCPELPRAVARDGAGLGFGSPRR